MAKKTRRDGAAANEPTPVTALYFREVGFGHDPALVFAPAGVAEEVDRIHRAIRESKTWGEFRCRMPAAAYAALYADYFSDDPEVFEEDLDAVPPADDEPFSSERVPGYCEGDYPLWIASVQERFLPEDLLQAYGTREDSFLNGSFWRIYSPRRDAMLGALRARGYEVTERADLNFW